MDHVVDTKGYLILCQKLSPKLQIPIQDCARCEYHRGIKEVWPEENDIEIDDVSLETVKLPKNIKTDSGAETIEEDTGSTKAYHIICGLPVKIKAVIYGRLLKEI